MFHYSVRLVDGTLKFLPAWMTDPVVCSGMKISDSPIVSLNSLRDLWEIIQGRKENQDQTFNTSSATSLEGDGHGMQTKGPATGNKVRRGRDLGTDTTQGAEQGPGALRADDPGKEPAGKGGETG
jgi:hypothetical protein